MKLKYSLLYRLWHWTMAFSVIGLLFTVLLRKSFLSYKANALIMQNQLASMDMTLSIESAKVIAKAIRAPMWEWHYIFALFLGISLAVRLYMLVRGQALPPLLAFLRADKEDKAKTFVYFFLYLSLVIMVLSGSVVYFHEALGWTKASVGWVKEIHEWVMYVVLAGIILHLGGVLIHEITTKEGIVSKMIHGDNKKD